LFEPVADCKSWRSEEHHSLECLDNPIGTAPKVFPMKREPLAMRRFGMGDQLAFAELSGDHNPIHLDAVAARRTQAGAPVVHGMHELLWALDELAGSGIIGPELCQIGAQFRKFLYLDVPCNLVLTSHDARATKAELRSDGLILATLQLRNGPRVVSDSAGLALPAVDSVGHTPAAPEISALTGLSGWTSTPAAAAQFEHTFPRLARAVGAERVAALAALSRIVGMYCPGLHSIFAGLTIDLVGSQPNSAGLGFKVTMVNDRFRLIGMNVDGSGITGKATAFMRWPPVEPPPMDVVRRSVAAEEFAGAAALVIGGSRGLGAVTAKAIAAGGGKVFVTYVQGRDEAGKLAAEIRAMRHSDACVAFAYDSSGDTAAQLAALGEDVNQLYYFATPPIFRRTSDLFSPDEFRNFCSVYVDGFYNVCRFVRARSRAPELAVFYPSSVAVEQGPAGLAEYAMAKAAGEALCAEMMRQIPEVKIVVGRLPRVLTDQTATIAQVHNADPLAVMLPFIRELRQPA
jgi:NADP-dependent 3-hydroxy acid dehydrogenase YdfG